MKINKQQRSTIKAAEEPSNNVRTKAISSIKDAIDTLSEDAKKGDAEAKDAIANLSVILLDLQ